MRNIILLAVLILAGCNKESDASIKPNQLLGTWNSLPTINDATEKHYARWTFDTTYVYIKPDTQKLCQPINSYHTGSYYQYWIEDNQLIMRYAGITNGLFPIPDIKRQIISVSENEMMLSNPIQVLEKCL